MALAHEQGAAARAATGGWGAADKYGLLILAVLLLAVLPLSLDVFRLGLAAKYLSLGFCAVGIVLIWGYGGILSLGQGVFFGLGSYMMAMFLKLESTVGRQFRPGAVVFLRVQSSRLHGVEQRGKTALVVGAVPPRVVHRSRNPDHSAAARVWSGLRGFPPAGRRRVFLHHDPGAVGHPVHHDHRSAGRDRRCQRHQ